MQQPDPRTDPQLASVPEQEGYKVLDRRYVIYETLGQGGMGVVYRGRHAELEIDLAIKCLDPSLARRNANFITRFKKEARSAARIRNENVVQVIDVSEHEGLHYLVMEFVAGEDLRKRVARKGALAPEEAARIAFGAASGLTAAHAAGLVHRDIKPDNILIGLDGTVKVADLGLVKSEDSEAQLTSTGATMGTPLYMPPEQFGDTKRVGPPADVYALGATLYYLLVGSDAIPHGSFVEVADHVRSKPFPDPRARRAEVPEALAELVLECTRKNPDERPREAGVMMRKLEGLLTGTGPELADPGAGTVAVDSMVSPPPPETLARIRLSLAGEQDSPAPTLETARVEGERRAIHTWALALVSALLVAALAWSARGWWAAAESAPTATSIDRPRQRDRAPEGMAVVKAAAGPDQSTQAPGPAAAAGWAWKVRHEATGIEFILVEPGSFLMGSPQGEEHRRDDEGPQHGVTLTQPFYLARTEVSQAQWEREMGSRPSHITGDPDRPVESVSWDNCQPFLERYGWSLPSEAEWEYACRAGTITRFSSGDSDADLARVAWYGMNGSETTHPVGTKRANSWGFHDMLGNVWEWCRDWYSPSYYGNGPSSDPENLTSASYRVLRGGSYGDSSPWCRSAYRNMAEPSKWGWYFGFRPRAGVTLP